MEDCRFVCMIARSYTGISRSTRYRMHLKSVAVSSGPVSDAGALSVQSRHLSRDGRTRIHLAGDVLRRRKRHGQIDAPGGHRPPGRHPHLGARRADPLRWSTSTRTSSIEASRSSDSTAGPRLFPSAPRSSRTSPACSTNGRRPTPASSTTSAASPADPVSRPVAYVLLQGRYAIRGLYLLDEPETALSPKTRRPCSTC